MKFTDAATVAGTRRTGDGYLVADARIARPGIQAYLGSEVDKPDMSMVKVYRPGAEVLAEDTLKSAAHRPVTNNHPPEMVTSDNWKKYAVGQIGDKIVGESIYLRVPLIVSDEATIKDIETGKQELSAGYTCDLEFTAGKTPDAIHGKNRRRAICSQLPMAGTKGGGSHRHLQRIMEIRFDTIQSIHRLCLLLHVSQKT
jgi:hypothetical protein